MEGILLRHSTYIFSDQIENLRVKMRLTLYFLPLRGKGAMQKRVNALRELRRLLSKSEYPPVEAALKAGAMPTLVRCLSFDSPDEQV